MYGTRYSVWGIEVYKSGDLRNGEELNEPVEVCPALLRLIRGKYLLKDRLCILW